MDAIRFRHSGLREREIVVMETAKKLYVSFGVLESEFDGVVCKHQREMKKKNVS